MQRLPWEVMEVIAFHAGDFYTYVALGFQRQPHAETLMWINGGPGAVLTSALLRQAPVDTNSDVGGGSCQVDGLRVLNFLRDHYGGHLTLDVVLTKAVLTKHLSLLHRVSVVWGVRGQPDEKFPMAMMAAVTSNLWEAFHYLDHLHPALPSSASLATGRRSGLSKAERYWLEIRQQGRNIYNLVQGEFEQIDFTIRKPLRCISVLAQHPDPDRIHTLLTDDVFAKLFRRQHRHKHLLLLAAHMGRHSFLRKALSQIAQEYKFGAHRIDFWELVRKAQTGRSPRMATQLLTEFHSQLQPQYWSSNLIWWHVGHPGFEDDLETLLELGCQVGFYRQKFAYYDNITQRQTFLDATIARGEVESIKGYLMQKPEEKESVFDRLIYHQKLHLLPLLLAPAPLETGQSQKQNGGGGDGKEEDANQTAEALGDDVGGFLPMRLIEKYEARIVAALMRTNQLKEVYEQQLGKYLQPDTPLTLSVFVQVELHLKVKMLREGLVTDEAAIQRHIGGSSWRLYVFQTWKRFLEFAPYCNVSKAEGTISQADHGSFLGTSDADDTFAHTARTLRERGLLQTLLPDKIAIGTRPERSDDKEEDKMSWKELIDWAFFDMPRSSLRMTSDSVSAYQFGRITFDFWGPWYYTKKKAPLDFENYTDVAFSAKSSAAAETSPLSSINDAERSIAFLDMTIPVDAFLRSRWVEKFEKWYPSLDPSLYCRFLADVLGKYNKH